MRKIAIAGLVVLAAFGVACGSGGTDSAVSNDAAQPVETAATEKTTATAKIGQTVILNSVNVFDDDTAVDITVANPKQHTKEPGAYGSKPEKGVFLAVDVTVVCKQGSYHANPFNFKFVAKDGRASEQAFTVGFKPQLEAIDLSTGQKTSGKIVFDVPKAALTGGRIQIDGIGLDFDKPAAYWNL